MSFGFRKPFFLLAPLCAAVLCAQSISPPAPFADSLRKGVDLYRASRFTDAAVELRRARAEAADERQSSEALYWLALAELSGSEYEAALGDMDALEDLGGGRTVDIAYHKGRAYFYLGEYEDAIILLSEYAAKAGEGERARVSSAYYWIGECLFALGQFDRAREFYMTITEKYPESVKREAASYRVALINQKKVEAELLVLLKRSHEESLKTAEEFRRREIQYGQTLDVYQRQEAEILRDSRLAELEKANAEYKTRLNAAQERARVLEETLASQPAEIIREPAAGDLRAWALHLRGEMEKDAKSMEDTGGAP